MTLRSSLARSLALVASLIGAPRLACVGGLGEWPLASLHRARRQASRGQLGIVVLALLALLLATLGTVEIGRGGGFGSLAANHGYDAPAAAVASSIRGYDDSRKSVREPRASSDSVPAAKAGATRTAGTALELSTYPASRGFFGGFSTTETLKVGTKIDRFGFEGGRYVSPAGTPFSKRGLPFTAARKPYGAYEVVRPIEVEAGLAAPAFGQPGLGVQYVLPGSVGDLIRAGVIRRVP